jgi:hypothetical protein
MSLNFLRKAGYDFRSEQWTIGYVLVQRVVSGLAIKDKGTAIRHHENKTIP